MWYFFVLFGVSCCVFILTGLFRLIIFSVLLLTTVCILVVQQSITRSYAHMAQKPTYLCPHFRDGLGNLMFMYASLYGIAKANHMTLVIEHNDTIASLFPNLDVMKMKDSAIICDNAVAVFERRPCAYDIEMVNINRFIDIKHKSYLQSFKYFEKYKESIRAQFQFRSDIQKEAEDVLNNIRYQYTEFANYSNLQIIGVHIRRGDYLEESNIEIGFVTASKNYLDKAFQYFRERFKTCLFIVFTGPSKEDQKWREENVKGRDVVFAPSNKREVDMCALTKCNHTIVTVGSFGWWSAWLGNGRTVHLKNVARENSTVRNFFSDDMTDFFPPVWIGLS